MTNPVKSIAKDTLGGSLMLFDPNGFDLGCPKTPFLAVFFARFLDPEISIKMLTLTGFRVNVGVSKIGQGKLADLDALG